MRKLLALLGATALLLTSCSSSSVGKVDAQTWISQAQSSQAQIIDVRTADEFNSGHIAGAINIDVEGGSFTDQISALDKDKTYALYCHSGRRSAIAASDMSKAGFKNIIDLNGGIGELLQAGAQLG